MGQYNNAFEKAVIRMLEHDYADLLKIELLNCNGKFNIRYDIINSSFLLMPFYHIRQYGFFFKNQKFLYHYFSSPHTEHTDLDTMS